MNDLEFASSIWFWAYLPLCLMGVFQIRRRVGAFRMAMIPGGLFAPGTLKTRLSGLPSCMRWLSAAVLILALARPRVGEESVEILKHGVDIFLAMDTSGSMLAHDFQLDGVEVDRLTAIQSVAKAFVDARTEDRIGLVVFGSVAFTQGPLTLDHRMVKQLLEDLTIGMAGRETALGDALGTAVSRIKDQESQSKVVILLTDGTNTAGSMDPKQAAEIAAVNNIRVHCIGIGREGLVKMPQQTPFGTRWVQRRSDLDEATLKQIAALTGGEFFRAENLDALQKVYERIDSMETTEAVTQTHENFEEFYVWPLALAMLLLFLAEALGATLLRRLP